MSGIWVPPSVGEDPTKIQISLDPRELHMEGVATHGRTPFSVSYITQIDGNLWTGGCTDGLILPDEIEHVVSLYPWEQYVIRHELKSFSMNWLYDSDEIEAEERLDAISAWAASCVDDGPTLIHCQAGLNRSGLIAALVLIRRGMEPEAAIALLREKRSPAVLCNRTFSSWLLRNSA